MSANGVGNSYKLHVTGELVLVYLLIVGTSTIALAQGTSVPVNWQNPYYDAVPAFINSATNSFQPVGNKEEIFQWAQQTKTRLPEFLNDMIAVSAEIEHNPFKLNDWELVRAFDQKWLDVFATCPNCEEAVFPLLKPLVDEMIRGFPALPAQKKGELSTDYLYRIYSFLSDVNPWRLGAFFNLTPLPKTNRTVTIHEEALETRTHGVQNTFVRYRQTVVQENLQVKFFESIVNDKVQQVSGDQGPPTLIHEVADQLREQGADPNLVKALQALTNYIDEQLRMAWQKGTLDDFSYHYLYNQYPIQNELVYVSHPLFLHPSGNDPRKVQEFYPRDYATQFYANQGWLTTPTAPFPSSTNNPLINKSGGSGVPVRPVNIVIKAVESGTSNPSTTEGAPITTTPLPASPVISPMMAPPLQAPAILLPEPLSQASGTNSVAPTIPDVANPPLISDQYIEGVHRLATFFTSGMFLPVYMFGILGIHKFLSL